MKQFIKIQILSVLVFFNGLILFAQGNSFYIISTNNLDAKDLSKIQEIYQLLEDYKITSNFQVKYGNFLTEESDFYECRNKESFYDVDTNYINGSYQKSSDFESYINQEMINRVSFQYIKPNVKKGKLNLKFSENTSSDVIDFKKWIKKNKKSKKDLYLIWNNGFQFYKYSPEYISRIILQRKKNNTTESLIPRITKPDPKSTNVVRPDESHYKIEFDSVGLFPKYQIQVSRKLKDGDSILILNECLDFMKSDSFNLNKSRIKIALFIKNGKKCVFAISENELGVLCVQSLDSGKAIEIDESCDCKNDCLYHNKFSVVIKGCVDGIDENEIPAIYLPVIRFQCNASD
jgi:hypothetical protein